MKILANEIKKVYLMKKEDSAKKHIYVRTKDNELHLIDTKDYTDEYVKTFSPSGCNIMSCVRTSKMIKAKVYKRINKYTKKAMDELVDTFDRQFEV